MRFTRWTMVSACALLTLLATRLPAADAPPLLPVHPMLRTALVLDAEGWTQGVRYEVFNPSADRAIALVVSKPPWEDVHIGIADAQGFPVAGPMRKRPDRDPADPADRDYRYVIVMPRTAFTSYVPIPATIIDRALAPAEQRLIPVPAGTYQLTFSCSFAYTLLEAGADTYAEVAGRPVPFGQVLGPFPTRLTARIAHEHLVPDF